LQVEIRDASGRLIGRVDILLERVTIVEFDGATKYGNADDLVAEKWREDDLRSRGYQVVRVGCRTWITRSPQPTASATACHLPGERRRGGGVEQVMPPPPHHFLCNGPSEQARGGLRLVDGEDGAVQGWGL
jgi:hypothetical protein